MTMNYEFERHIKANENAGKKEGIDLLRKQQQEFNQAVQHGLVLELPSPLRKRRIRHPATEQPVENSLSLESKEGGLTLSVDLDPKKCSELPTCPNCGSSYKMRDRYSRIVQKEKVVEVIFTPRWDKSKRESVSIPNELINDLGIKDPQRKNRLFPFKYNDVFNILFKHEDPRITYNRIHTYLAGVSEHSEPIMQESCQRYMSFGTLRSASVWMKPILIDLLRFGYSTREIAALIPLTGHMTIARIGKELNLEKENSPILNRKTRKALKLKWEGIELSPQEKVVSRLDIVGNLPPEALDQMRKGVK